MSSRVYFKNSIANYLFKKVFAIYIIIALSVTVVHMVAEYQFEKTYMTREFKSLQKIFEPGLALALWHVDEKQLMSNLKGMIEQPSLVGVKIEFGKEMTGLGTIMDSQGNPVTLDDQGNALAAVEFSNLFAYQFPIFFDYQGELREVGITTFYSSETIILQKLQYGFLFLLVNSLIKTFALWWIFLVMGRRFLSAPLGQLTHAIDQLDLDKLQPPRFQLEVPAKTELKVLETAFKSMVDKLLLSRKKLEESHESLRQADKMASLGILVAGMAHEVNNPNNFIKVNIRILKDAWKDTIRHLRNCEKHHACKNIVLNGMDLDYAAENISVLIDGINEGADRIDSLVKNLKDYSRMTPVNLNGTVDLNKVVKASVLLLRNPLNKATNHLSIQQKKKLPFVRGDAKRIEQVLINLIQNACDALENKEQRITITTDCKDDQVLLKIQDEGIGIPSKYLEQVCTPFFTTKQNSNGTGLGLSISLGIVKEHQGNMEFTSTPQQGTTVILTFPIQEKDE